MRVSDIANALDAEIVLINNDDFLNHSFSYCFASDLMSDALAMIQNDTSNVFLLTGLANPQSLRTAEMLDIKMIILVRGKSFDEETLEMAKHNGLSVMKTDLTMYNACGKLYELGVRGIHG